MDSVAQWALAFRYGDPGFKERSDHSLNLFLTVVGVTFCRFVHCVSLALKIKPLWGVVNQIMYVCIRWSAGSAKSSLAYVVRTLIFRHSPSME